MIGLVDYGAGNLQSVANGQPFKIPGEGFWGVTFVTIPVGNQSTANDDNNGADSGQVKVVVGQTGALIWAFDGANPGDAVGSALPGVARVRHRTSAVPCRSRSRSRRRQRALPLQEV